MWFLLGYLAGKSRPVREPSSEPFDDVARGIFAVICAFAVLALLGCFGFAFIAWVDARGLGSALLTIFYFVVGLPLLGLGFAWIGRRFK